MSDSPATLSINGKDYVVLPRAEYLKLVQKSPKAPVLRDARLKVRASLGTSLRKAREAADLTQTELASRLGISQAMVSAAEAGRQRVAERYVARVLKACGLPKDWTPGRPARSSKHR
jgi:ribosome-binding protein aMBF1 (putative translation factor)